VPAHWKPSEYFCLQHSLLSRDSCKTWQINRPVWSSSNALGLTGDAPFVTQPGRRILLRGLYRDFSQSRQAVIRILHRLCYFIYNNSCSSLVPALFSANHSYEQGLLASGLKLFGHFSREKKTRLMTQGDLDSTHVTCWCLPWPERFELFSRSCQKCMGVFPQSIIKSSLSTNARHCHCLRQDVTG
jgi:hypothetical protein